MLFDTHAHLMFDQFDGDFAEVIARAKAQGVGKIVNVACGIETSEKAMEMAADKPDFFSATLGLHPYEADQFTEDLMKEWQKLVEDDCAAVEHASGVRKIVAIGETGLDYLKSPVPRDAQRLSFDGHLRLAAALALPVIVHNRDADEDCFEILQRYPEVKAVFHCFSADIAFAKRVWEKGYFTSFTANITYPSAGDLREVVKAAPLNQIMIETDSPYLAPQGLRGMRNEPANVREVFEQICETREERSEELENALWANSLQFFKIEV